MTRLAFVLVTATLVLASLSWWWRPPLAELATIGSGPESPPEAVEHAAAADRGDPAAPPAAESPSPARASGVSPPPAAEAKSSTGSPPGTQARAVGGVATPTLEEGALVELTPPEAFPGEGAGDGADAPPADAWTLASVPDELSAETPTTGTSARAQRAPSPVDIDRSGELVRRMLSLYEAMGE